MIGGKHTAFEHVTRGIPPHQYGAAKEITEELIKEGFILLKKTSYGLQISLNPRRLTEIVAILDKAQQP